MIGLVRPEWPVPPNVRAVSTLRFGGVSARPFDSLNLGDHVGDVDSRVAENRRRLLQAAGLPAEPRWLRQVHGTGVADLDRERDAPAEADAAVTASVGRVCAVLTADCLPVLLADRAGRRVGVAHAGWRGLAAGVLESCVAALGAPPAELLAWLGPCIGPRHFEVGPEVREAFLAADPAAGAAFGPGRGSRWFADLQTLAAQRLGRLGVREVHRSPRCTYAESEAFFSHRRDGRSGRQATLIWLAEPAGGAA